MTPTQPPPTTPTAARPWALLAAIALSALLIEAALWHIAARTPADAVLGVVQKIFYFHVATAFVLLLGMVAGAALSALDLVAPSERVDAAARACLEVGTVFGVMVLVSGPLWARKSWGMYWTWEPRLTLTLLVVLLATTVLLVRGLASDGAIGRRVGAALAVLAAPAALLIHLAVKLWGGNHPSVLQGGGIDSAAMRVSFWLAVAGMIGFASCLVAVRYRALRLRQRVAELELDLSALALRRQRGEEAT
jgi:heme exporter protein C